MRSNFETQNPRAWRPPPPNIQFGQIVLNYEDLRELGITYSKEHLRRLEADGLFPGRVRFSPARVAWMFNEVVAWINDRADSRVGAHNAETKHEQ